MKEKIPEEVLSIYKRLENSGFEVYFVGGCVRNILLQKNPKDWDLTTNATPAEIQSVFPDSFYDNSFGTVGIPLPQILENEHKGVVEITTYRTEGKYKDHRRPEDVSWGKTIQEDLQRRDFTMNAIAFRLEETSTSSLTFIDPFDGIKDIELKMIKAVGNPDERFKEDALRLMRAVRLATQLGFLIDADTLIAIRNDAKLINHVSGERIRDELIKILATECAYEGIMLLDSTGLLQHILPELEQGKGVSQERPGRHHTADVFTHNVLSLKHTPATDPIVRFATLLHDAGKPMVRSEDEQGLVIFYNHEIAGAKIARSIADRLHLSKKDREKIITLIRWHMFTVDENITDSAIRRFIRRVGIENVKDMIDLRIGDRLGSGTQTAESWRLKQFKERIVKELNPPFSINDLAVDGNDIMQVLKITPGPKIGEVLQKIFLEVDENLELNNREYLLKRVMELGKD
ncbi:MAG: HD domain-containing protein [Candidatus Levybacteria bacterium]|nr:HD domain-containing protein [Candidatus Levybacteria bacterium]MBP9815281.1 HD domain-containing protein [Candidatus Levybacteria bacterium]